MGLDKRVGAMMECEEEIEEGARGLPAKRYVPSIDGAAVLLPDALYGDVYAEQRFC